MDCVNQCSWVCQLAFVQLQRHRASWWIIQLEQLVPSGLLVRVLDR